MYENADVNKGERLEINKEVNRGMKCWLKIFPNHCLIVNDDFENTRCLLKHWTTLSRRH